MVSSLLIFRQEAIRALGPLLTSNGELLPLRCSDAELSIFNPTRVLDALDEERSEVRRVAGPIIAIKRHAFKTEVIEGVDVFKITSMRASPIFVSGSFVRAWRAAGLRQLNFRLVWPDAGDQSSN
jgi:hypothetical protein